MFKSRQCSFLAKYKNSFDLNQVNSTHEKTNSRIKNFKEGIRYLVSGISKFSAFLVEAS